MAEFELRFLWKEIGRIARVIPPAGTRIVCHQAIDADTIVPFALEHVLRYRGQAQIYFSDQVDAVPILTLGGPDDGGFPFYVLDDLRLPEHIGISGYVPEDSRILPRLRLSLQPKFTELDSSRTVSAGPAIKDVFAGIRRDLMKLGRRVNHKSESIILTAAAEDAVRNDKATTADAELDASLRT